MSAASWMIEDSALWPVSERYVGAFSAPPISYGTVRDLADSADNMPKLAIKNLDLEDLQRCWTVKAILGNVPRGSRIVEIHAGRPFVADMLSRLGYEVTVIDPYDAGGNGPRDFKDYEETYPSVHFVRDTFPPNEPLRDIAAVYSISVLHQLPPEQAELIVRRGHELVSDGGCSIHTVEHVLAGWAAEEHREKLKGIVDALHISSAELDERLAEMREDPETFFVSAETHNRRRGDVPYDRYPMRRIGSVNLFQRAD